MVKTNMKIDSKFIDDVNYCSDLIDLGQLNEAFILSKKLLEKLNKINRNDVNYFFMLSNLAGYFVDIGSMLNNPEAAEIGFNLMKDNENVFISILGESDFYYNYANARNNLIKKRSPFDNDFFSIEALVDVKNYYWKSICSSLQPEAEHLINLANTLKQQFRLIEALKYYDEVIALNLDIPQAWVNRSDALRMLNIISNSYSIKMLEEIRKGFSIALNSTKVPPQWRQSWIALEKHSLHTILEARAGYNIEEEMFDDELTAKEYNALSFYRKFSLEKKLTLSEHSLYCPCAASSKDDLTILMSSQGISGDFVIPMENILNRLKSEFVFARQLFHEYYQDDEKDDVIFHESSFAELYNDELLGIKVEKLRSAFRLCFGILDKIGMAVCELYDLYPAKDKKVYFQNFWQLDKNERRQLFEKNKSPGLLALYSIATDLNDKKYGELSFFKDWRNKLEHAFLVIHSSDSPDDVYNSYKYMQEDILFIKEEKFINELEKLLQITRAAIFSFVYVIRHQGMLKNDNNKVYLTNTIYPKCDK